MYKRLFWPFSSSSFGYATVCARILPILIIPFLLPFSSLSRTAVPFALLVLLAGFRLWVLSREARREGPWRWAIAYHIFTGLSSGILWGTLIAATMRLSPQWALHGPGLYALGMLLLWLMFFGVVGVWPLQGACLVASLGGYTLFNAMSVSSVPRAFFGILAFSDAVGLLTIGMSAGLWWAWREPAQPSDGWPSLDEGDGSVPWRIDLRGRLVDPVPALCELLPGLRKASEPYPTLNAALHGDNPVQPEGEAMSHKLDRRISFSGHLERVMAPGSGHRWLLISGDPVVSVAGFSGFSGIIRDVTDVVLAHRDAERRTAFDPLTGLAGRDAFFDELRTRCIDGQPHVLMLFGFSGFRAINMELSHEIGDWLIEVLAQRLEAAVDEHGVIGRVTGNCFAVLHPLGAADDPRAQAERFRAVLQAPSLVEGTRIVLRMAAGIAIYPGHGESPEILFRHADLALSVALANDGPEPVLYSDALEHDYIGEIRMGGELATAIEAGDIDIALQPILDARDGRLFAAEVLLRWPSQPLNPAQVVALAEATGQIQALGIYILREACFLAAESNGALSISVNLSPHQLMQGDFVDELRTVLRETGLVPAQLTLEVTEGVFLTGGPAVRAQLQAIRMLGIEILLDDFGTGFSSLIYLRDFDVGGIKLDAGFIADLPAPRAQAIVRGVQGLAQGLGMRLIAEGVETKIQSDWLRERGIVLQQGYYFARPVAPEYFEEALVQGRARIAGR